MSAIVGARARARASHSSSSPQEWKFHRGVTICPCSVALRCHGEGVDRWSHSARERAKLPQFQKITKERDDVSALLEGFLEEVAFESFQGFLGSLSSFCKFWRNTMEGRTHPLESWWEADGRSPVG